MLHELVIKQSKLVSYSCILYLLQHNLSWIGQTHLMLCWLKAIKIIFFIATNIKPLMTFKMVIEGWL